ALKIQAEDDITASVVVPPGVLKDLPELEADKGSSVKFVLNTEARLFQRPDDAIHRGYDKVTEADFSRPDNFFSNYEPLPAKTARELIEDAIGFYQFTEPMQALIKSVAANGVSYFVCSANPRLVDGKPTKNPRYLQIRPDLTVPCEGYLAEMGARLRRHLPPGRSVLNPVAAVLPGRRNNPPETGIRSLACYNPIHY